MRPTAFISDSARRRTQASNRVVNMYLLGAAGGRRSRLLVDLDDLRGHGIPSEAAGLLVAVSAHPAPQVGVSGEDDQCRPQLGPALRLHGHAVVTRLQH